eukprot:Pompholyxophrys_punicea_v1_NODE_296_length_2339_cov_2.955342.p1 type:complete len:392 gc:universal NODE_296_length_2339_cov_2.955342:1926-751(-)
MPKAKNTGPCFIEKFGRTSRSGTTSSKFGPCEENSFHSLTPACLERIRPEFEYLKETSFSTEQVCDAHYKTLFDHFSVYSSVKHSPVTVNSSSLQNLLPSPKRLKIGTVEINAIRKNGSTMGLSISDIELIKKHILDLEENLNIAKSNPNLADEVKFCISFLLKRKSSNKPEIYSWDSFLSMLEAEDSSGRFKKFLLHIYNSCFPQLKCEKTQVTLKKRVISIMYYVPMDVMYSANKQVSALQKSVGLRSSSKITTESMRSMHLLGVTPPPQSVNRIQHRIVAEHVSTVTSFIQNHSTFSFTVNLDDFTDIWEKKEPEVVTRVEGKATTVVKTHNVNLMATCIIRPINNCPPIFLPERLNFAELHFTSYTKFLTEQNPLLATSYYEWKMLS